MAGVPIGATQRQMPWFPGTQPGTQINIESRGNATARPYISPSNINCEQNAGIRLNRILQLGDSVPGHRYGQYASVYRVIVNNIVEFIGYNDTEAGLGYLGGRRPGEGQPPGRR